MHSLGCWTPSTSPFLIPPFPSAAKSWCTSNTHALPPHPDAPWFAHSSPPTQTAARLSPSEPLQGAAVFQLWECLSTEMESACLCTRPVCRCQDCILQLCPPAMTAEDLNLMSGPCLSARTQLHAVLSSLLLDMPSLKVGHPEWGMGGFTTLEGRS